MRVVHTTNGYSIQVHYNHFPNDKYLSTYCTYIWTYTKCIQLLSSSGLKTDAKCVPRALISIFWSFSFMRALTLYAMRRHVHNDLHTIESRWQIDMSALVYSYTYMVKGYIKTCHIFCINIVSLVRIAGTEQLKQCVLDGCHLYLSIHFPEYKHAHFMYSQLYEFSLWN